MKNFAALEIEKSWRFDSVVFQIVLLGDNFVGKHGGAIFVQDIIVDGDLASDCTITTAYTAERFSKPREEQAKRLIPLHDFQDSANSPVEVQEVDTKLRSNPRQPSALQLASSLLTDSLMVQCLKLSCNPAGKLFFFTIISIFAHQRMKYKLIHYIAY